MSNTPNPKKKEEKESEWRRGYEVGIQTVMQQNSRAIKIGEAILDVMYEIFEPRDNNYD